MFSSQFIPCQRVPADRHLNGLLFILQGDELHTNSKTCVSQLQFNHNFNKLQTLPPTHKLCLKLETEQNKKLLVVKVISTLLPTLLLVIVFYHSRKTKTMAEG